MNRRYLGILALTLCTSAPVRAGVVTPSTTIDEYADRQSVGIESAFFGPALPASTLGHSLAVHPALGGHGSEGLLAGASVVWHTTELVPWDMGVSVGVVDFDLAGVTWTLALSSGKELWRGDRASLAVEAAMGYQFLADDPNDELAFESGETILVDQFDLVHLMAHAMYSLDLKYFTPMVEAGFTGTHYRMDGWVWDGSFPITREDSRSERGGVGSATFGLGVSLNTPKALLFAGVKSSTGRAGVVQVSLGLRF